MDSTTSVEDGFPKSTIGRPDTDQNMAQFGLNNSNEAIAYGPINTTAPTYGPFKPLQSFKRPAVTLRLKFDPLKTSTKSEQKTLKILPNSKKRKLKLLDRTPSKHDVQVKHHNLQDTPKYGKRQLTIASWVELKENGNKT